MTRRAWLIALTAAAGMTASVLLAEPGIVKTRDGATYQGEIRERGDNVIITIRGVETVIPRTNVASIEQIVSFEEEFRSRLAKLDAKDVAGRIALAREAFDRRQYELSRAALENALEVDPNSAEATRLLEIVNSQIRMERSRMEPAPAPETPTVTGPRPPLTGQAAIERRVLLPPDIETIRRLELKPSDTGVRIRFDGDVKKRFADSQNVPFGQFVAMTPVEQALDILTNGDDSMRDKVHILSDPQSIREFRSQIMPVLLNGCATSGCHGGPAGGGLVLLTPADNDAIAYTNFYIVQSYSRKPPEGTGGIFGDSSKKLIERGRGEQSLLANYTLPITVSEYDHPLVNGKPIQPIFRNKEDAKYKFTVDWMNQSLVPIDPDYGIRYSPPTAVMGAATQPAEPPVAP